jgi:hypothetical protein
MQCHREKNVREKVEDSNDSSRIPALLVSGLSLFARRTAVSLFLHASQLAIKNDFRCFRSEECPVRADRFYGGDEIWLPRPISGQSRGHPNP